MVRSLRAGLDRILRTLGDQVREGVTLDSAWPEVVGPDLAPHATYAGLQDGALRIVVDQPAWAATARYAQKAIVERANAVLGAPVVTRLIVTVAR